MKNVSKDFSTFEKFKLENPKAIVGGTNNGGTNSGGTSDGGIIDPPNKPLAGGGRP